MIYQSCSLFYISLITNLLKFDFWSYDLCLGFNAILRFIVSGHMLFLNENNSILLLFYIYFKFGIICEAINKEIITYICDYYLLVELVYVYSVKTVIIHLNFD